MRSTVLSVAVLALGLLCYFCLHTHAPMIQQNVRANVQEALNANHIPSDNLAVDGRDVTLKGAAGSPEISDAAQRAAASAEGVNSVRVETTVSPVTAADASTRTETPVAPAPSAAQTAAQTNLDNVLAQGIVEFDPSSARLTAQGRSVLDRIAQTLAAAPAMDCEIQGHTDSLGNAAANQDLSYRRAVASKTYLEAKGIAAARLTAKGFGDTQPIASNETPEGRRKNRRINFVVKEKP